MKSLINYLPIQWWVLKKHPPIIVNPLRLSKPEFDHWCKTTWWYVITGKHKGSKLKLAKP